MVKFSLAMIVKNEEDVLNRCLEGTKNIFDEIIIVDTGSTDSTKKIAEGFTDRVFDFEWIEDFAAARNFAFSKASMDYIMWLDADDVITEENRIKLIGLKEKISDNIDIIMMKYDVDFDENDNVIFSYFRERLIKNNSTFLWNDPVHETIALSGNIYYSDVHIQHRKIKKPQQSERNINIYRKLIRDKKEFTPRQLFYYARELMHNNYLNEAILYFNKFLNIKNAYKENYIDACKSLAECYTLLNEDENILKSLFKSFEYDTPRAEICCDIADYFMDKEKYRDAIYWFEVAASCIFKPERGGFHQIDCYGFIPNLQLCVCYDKLNNIKLAKKYNDIAAQYKPNNPAILHNIQYFKKLEENLNNKK